MLGTPTSVSIRLRPVPVLQPIGPGSVVFGGRGDAEFAPVPPLISVRPLASVDPPSSGLDTEPVAFAVRPLSFVRVAGGPSVQAGLFETLRPRAAELALALGPRAHAVAVGFAVGPAAAVGSAVVEVEAPAAAGPERRRASHPSERRGSALRRRTAARAIFREPFFRDCLSASRFLFV